MQCKTNSIPNSCMTRVYNKKEWLGADREKKSGSLHHLRKMIEIPFSLVGQNED